MTVDRRHWLRHVKDVIRSRHYTWLPQGLGGQPVDEAMTYLTTDIMHICKLAGVSFDSVLDGARQRFAEEESAEFPAGTATAEMPHALQEADGDKVVALYETNDVYTAEIVRGILQAEGISCRLDSQSQGGFTELVNTKVLVHARDLDQAQAAIRQQLPETPSP